MSTPDYNDEASAKKASADTYAAETAALPKTDYADNPTNMQYAAPPESFASGAAPAAAAVQGTQKRSNKVVLLAAGVALACGLAGGAAGGAIYTAAAGAASSNGMPGGGPGGPGSNGGGNSSANQNTAPGMPSGTNGADSGSSGDSH